MPTALRSPESGTDRRCSIGSVVTRWLVRLLPVGALAVLLQQVVVDDADWRTALAAEAPDIIGNAALFCLAVTMAVTPLVTLTGAHWHVPLRRDMGLWTVALGAFEVVVGAATGEGGWLTGVAGTAFLAAGTAATIFALPLAATSYRAAQRLFGRQWKVLHRFVHLVVLMVLIHMAFLGPDQLALAIALFGPSYLLRIPPIRRTVVATRQRRTSSTRGVR